MTERLYRIGELSAATGVPVKTIRYYSDLGILPPSAVRGSGYRLYSEADRARLTAVRALRDIGVDLASIGRLLAAKSSVADTLALQLDAVEVGIRTLQRQRAVLRAAVARGGDEALAYLDRLRRLARLDAVERQTLLDTWLDRAFAGIPVGARFAADLRRLVTLDVPDALTDAQLDAWLELAELVTDDDFLARMREIGRDAWSAADPTALDDAQHEARRALEADALRLADAGADPGGASGRAAAGAYVALHARTAARSPDAAFARELSAHVARNTDARAERFWALVAILKGWDAPHDLPTSRAYRWLHAALRATVEGWDSRA